jgi:hypothetical protein
MGRLKVTNRGIDDGHVFQGVFQRIGDISRDEKLLARGAHDRVHRARDDATHAPILHALNRILTHVVFPPPALEFSFFRYVGAIVRIFKLGPLSPRLPCDFSVPGSDGLRGFVYYKIRFFVPSVITNVRRRILLAVRQQFDGPLVYEIRVSMKLLKGVPAKVFSLDRLEPFYAHDLERVSHADPRPAVRDIFVRIPCRIYIGRKLVEMFDFVQFLENPCALIRVLRYL